jgi:hypothetical protein
MSEYRDVLIEWKDEPEEQYLTTVAIAANWVEGEDDDGVFFYFSNEQEFEQAKLDNDEFEFRIVGWTIITPANVNVDVSKATIISIQVFVQNVRMEKSMDEQAVEIRENLAEYFKDPESYTLFDFEEIFQDRDPFEFLWKRYGRTCVKGMVGK